MNKCAGSSSYAKGHLCESAPCADIRESGSSSPVRRLVVVIAECMLLAAISLCNPFAEECAYAATWPVPTSELSASVMFQQHYSAGEKSYVHSGIDIPASAGMQISSPLAGTVRFAGSVPSGDSRIGGASDQKTMLAVSIELQDGRVITLMPFAQVDVQAGKSVAEGDRLGTLAESGDASSMQTHLHMGLKQDGRYYDPLSLFGVAAQRGAEEPKSVVESAFAESDLPLLEPIPSSSVEAHAWDLLGSAEAAAAEEAAPSVQESFGTIESGAYDWHPRSERPASFASAVGKALEPLAAACADQAQECLLALGGISRNTGVPVYVLVCASAMLVLASGIALLLIIAYLAAPRVRVMWRNRKSSLSVHEGGDSMHKLFPASGTAFISRSRMSPREVTK